MIIVDYHVVLNTEPRKVIEVLWGWRDIKENVEDEFVGELENWRARWRGSGSRAKDRNKATHWDWFGTREACAVVVELFG